MEELSKHGKKGLAAMKAGMDRKTAAKYVAAGQLPSEMTAKRDWRTREDPFAEAWAEVEALLRDTPGLEAKTVFEVLCERYPERHQPGELRTLQRRGVMSAKVKPRDRRWREFSRRSHPANRCRPPRAA